MAIDYSVLNAGLLGYGLCYYYVMVYALMFIMFIMLWSMFFYLDEVKTALWDKCKCSSW